MSRVWRWHYIACSCWKEPDCGICTSNGIYSLWFQKTLLAILRRPCTYASIHFDDHLHWESNCFILFATVCKIASSVNCCSIPFQEKENMAYMGHPRADNVKNATLCHLVAMQCHRKLEKKCDKETKTRESNAPRWGHPRVEKIASTKGSGRCTNHQSCQCTEKVSCCAQSIVHELITIWKQYCNCRGIVHTYAILWSNVWRSGNTSTRVLVYHR